MNFPQSLRYLDALIEMGIKVGLDHTRALARALGDPQRSFPCVIVGGTNGKGSTAAYLAAILQGAGYRTGLFTSPHLVDVRERIRVDGRIIGKEAFAEAASHLRATAEAAMGSGLLEGCPTYFEALTLMGFLHFMRERVEAGVLEVGLGGRLDCTNIADPLVSVVTNVGRDHEEWLGKGVMRIAREKAGIFRPGVPALTAASGPRVLSVLRREAERLGTRLLPLSECGVSVGTEGWRMVCGRDSLDLPLPALPGRHQVDNAALAVRCCWVLRQLGWHVPDESIREGIAGARWPGRLELAVRSPETYLDGAHNPDGCRALARWVAGRPEARRALVFTAMKDKPIGVMAQLLFPSFGRVWATAVPMARCARIETIRRRSRGLVTDLAEDPGEALAAARRWAGRDGLVVAAGSLYLVGYLKSSLEDADPLSWGSGL
ncbi:MAG: folylpolyglutamate synthase/dihydrofolate synthase family protein [Acidobacteriota bacterium]